MSSVFTPPTKSAGTPTQPANNSARISTMRPLATAYKASTSDYQVFEEKQKRVFLSCLPLPLWGCADMSFNVIFAFCCQFFNDVVPLQAQSVQSLK